MSKKKKKKTWRGKAQSVPESQDTINVRCCCEPDKVVAELYIPAYMDSLRKDLEEFIMLYGDDEDIEVAIPTTVH